MPFTALRRRCFDPYYSRAMGNLVRRGPLPAEPPSDNGVSAVTIARFERALAERGLELPTRRQAPSPPPEPLKPLPPYQRRSRWRQWPWYALQAAIAVPIVVSDFRWNWSGNGMLAIATAVAAAFFATGMIVAAWDCLRRLSVRPAVLWIWLAVIATFNATLIWRFGTLESIGDVIFQVSILGILSGAATIFFEWITRPLPN